MHNRIPVRARKMGFNNRPFGLGRRETTGQVLRIGCTRRSVAPLRQLGRETPNKLIIVIGQEYGRAPSAHSSLFRRQKMLSELLHHEISVEKNPTKRLDTDAPPQRQVAEQKKIILAHFAQLRAPAQPGTRRPMQDCSLPQISPNRPANCGRMSGKEESPGPRASGGTGLGASGSNTLGHQRASFERNTANGIPVEGNGASAWPANADQQSQYRWGNRPALGPAF
jgi:hypothetical protein